MSASALAKDAIRVAQTAGLSKDVIDLLTQKVTLLDEKLTDTTLRLEETLARAAELESENEELRCQLNETQPSVEHLGDELNRVIKFLADEQPHSQKEIISATGFLASELSTMISELDSMGYVRIAQRGRGGIITSGARGGLSRRGHTPTLYRITPEGKAYADTL